MSGPNQTMREFGTQAGRWIMEDYPWMAESGDLRLYENRLLHDLAMAEDMVRVAGMRAGARENFMWPGELRAIYENRARAFANLLEFRAAITRLRLENTPMWLVRQTPGDLELVRMLPGKILRAPCQIHHDDFQQEYLCHPPDIAQGPDQAQVQMPDGSMPRPDGLISSGRRTGDALPGILQLGVDAASPMRWDSGDIWFTHPPDSRMAGRLENIYAGEGTYTEAVFPTIGPNVQPSSRALTMDDLRRCAEALGIPPVVPQHDGVPCDHCAAVVRPGDSYPVIWIGTRSRASLCEGCYRSEESAGRARPCAGLDDEAT